jgi:hypothetical protein
MGVGCKQHAPAAFTPEKYPISVVEEARWASEPVWIGAENLAPRSPDLPARSESQYLLSYPGSYELYLKHDKISGSTIS